MLVVGVILLAFGAFLALNVLRSADRMAAFSKPFPWWLKPIGADDPLTGRFAGAAFIVTGVVFVVLALR